ncbi:MAG: hypothetical protein Q8K00_20260 [Syntrophales bacterium]|nr:hypothetical protein [Syntrophales bacterium]
MTKELSAEKSFAGRRIWEAHIQAWEKSGLTAADYCRRHNLSYDAFHYWKKKITRTASAKGISLVPVPARMIEQGQQVTTVPGSALKVEVGGRFKIEVHGGFCPQTLIRVIAILEGCR